MNREERFDAWLTANFASKLPYMESGEIQNLRAAWYNGFNAGNGEAEEPKAGDGVCRRCGHLFGICKCPEGAAS